jgi:hypothetical protein
LLILALLLAACSPLAAQAPIAEQWWAVSVDAEPVRYPQRVGALIFRGGLELRSRDAAFGGFSGLEVLEDGRLLAVSDQGVWLEAQLMLDASNTLVGITGARLALMRDETGAPFADKEAGDAEGLTQLADGRFAVSFEQTQTLRIYDFNRDGPFGAAQAGPVLAGVARLPNNVGLEAIAVDGDGALIIGAEGDGASTPLWRAPLEATEPVAARASYRPEPGYALTGLDRLPGGGLVAVERFYAPVIGPRVRITRFTEAAANADGIVAPEELARLAPLLPVDNFEAVAAIAMPDGATRLYILSDDNFSDRQRTLLLAFDIAN